MNDNNKKGNTVLLTIIAVATLLVAVVGATFAYFTATVTGNDTASSVLVTTAKIGTITYENGQELKLENALPGSEKSIDFTIKSDTTSTDGVRYSIKWVDVTNDFTTTSDLVYTLNGQIETGSKGGTLVNTATTEQEVPANPNTIGSGILMPGETHKYTLKVTFKETYSDQNILFQIIYNLC